MENGFLTIFDNFVKPVVENAIQGYFEKKKSMLREVIRSEIREGDFSRVDEDDMIAISYRLHRDSIEGVAKKNLQLLCKLIEGMNLKEELKADNFLNYANVLSTLTEDEIIVLGSMIRSEKYTNLDEYKILKKEFGYSYSKVSAIQQALMRTGLIIIEISAETEFEKSDCLSEGLPEPDRYNTYAEIEFKKTKLFNKLLKYMDFDQEGA